MHQELVKGELVADLRLVLNKALGHDFEAYFLGLCRRAAELGQDPPKRATVAKQLIATGLQDALNENRPERRSHDTSFKESVVELLGSPEKSREFAKQLLRPFFERNGPPTSAAVAGFQGAVRDWAKRDSVGYDESMAPELKELHHLCHDKEESSVEILVQLVRICLILESFRQSQ